MLVQPTTRIPYPATQSKKREKKALSRLELSILPSYYEKAFPSRDYVSACAFEDAPHSSLKASPYQRWNWRAGAIFERFANPTIIKGWERNESFALGKRFAVAKLTARHFWAPYSVTRDPSQHRQRSLDSSRPGRLGSKLPVAYLTPSFLLRDLHHLLSGDKERPRRQKAKRLSYSKEYETSN